MAKGVYNEKLLEALKALGIGDLDTVNRVIIDINSIFDVTIYVQHVDHPALPDVLNAMTNVRVVETVPKEVASNG